MALLELRGITKAFSGVVATKNVTLDVNEGEIVALIGPNGSGKSTLFNVIAGTCRPDAGTIRFAGQDITGLKPHVINHRGLARTFQMLKPFSSMTVLENVMVGALPRASVAQAHKDALRYIGMVGLGSKVDVPARGLSTGQRKRLELARAMATRPRLLMLDEVTGGVDHKSIPDLLELIKRLRQEGTTLFIIEHSMRVTMSIADRIIALHLGEKIADGAPNEVATDRRVIEVYLGEVYAKDH